MKTLLKLILCTMLLIGCSKDDDVIQPQKPSTQELLIGKWFVTTTSDGTASECAEQTFFDFIDNEHLNHKFVGQISYVDGTFRACVTDLYGDYPYTLSADNTFSFTTEEFGLQTFKIVVISETNLVLTTEIESGVIIILLEKEN